MLDDRKAAILRAIVEEYVGNGHPVGSAAVANKARLPVSSATVRNEMMVLEAQGYISQPHTSAGRVPTDLGYRYYVDHLTSPFRLANPERASVASFFAEAHRELEDMLQESSRMLSRLTAYAAVVLGPPLEVSQIRDVHLVGLGPTTVLSVVVLSTGRIEKVIVEGVVVDDDDLSAASRTLTEGLRGTTLGDGSPPLTLTGRPGADLLAAQVAAGMASHVGADAHVSYFVGGAANLVGGGVEVADLQQLLDALEKQVAVVGMLSDALADPDVVVRIGAENHMPELREWSLVSAPYRAGGRPMGAVGVLGPTRMDYAKAISAVEAVSAGLGAAFGTMSGG
jgi:heat-inducible transcriptional repressor